jgi:GTP-binding protein EngB required for normal cell division
MRATTNTSELGPAARADALGNDNAARPPDSPISALPLEDLLSFALSSVANPSASQSKLLEQLNHLRDRLATERFQLAVLGQFKRGKSTVLNALLRAEVLPVGVVPVTAIPTFLETGATYALRVSYIAGKTEDFEMGGPDLLRERLIALVTEEHNPGNTLGIAQVDVRMPSLMLDRGVVLLDTPGVGSTLRHNTAAADAVLPECDAALFVLSPDPPVTEVEIEFLAVIRKTVARLLIVLNKIDTLESDERETAEAFLRRVLTEQAKLDASTPIFCLSARRALRACQTRDTPAFEASGFADFEAYLTEFLASDKRATLNAAVSRKASALVSELRLETEITLRALRLPIDDLERRMAAFDEAAGQFEIERRVAGDLLAGDRLRALEELEAEADRLRTEGRGVLERELDHALANGADSHAARDRLTKAVVSYFDTALKKVIKDVGERLAAMFGVHQRRADELITLVRQTAADLLEIPFRAPHGDEAFEPRRDPFWVTAARTVELSPISPDAMDRLLPASLRESHLRRRLLKEIDSVLIRNVENLRWATMQNLEDAFRRFGPELDDRLAMSLVATRGAMKAALDRRTQHSAAVGVEATNAQMGAARFLAIERELDKRAVLPSPAGERPSK